MIQSYTLSDCVNNNICDNGNKVKCQVHNELPIDHKYKYGSIIANDSIPKQKYYDKFKYYYKYSTLLKPYKLPFSSNTSNEQWQNDSTTNYGCKPYNCPQSVLLIRHTPVKYNNIENVKLSGSNNFTKYHKKNNVNGYFTSYDSLEQREISWNSDRNDSWKSQLFNEKCKYIN